MKKLVDHPILKSKRFIFVGKFKYQEEEQEKANHCKDQNTNDLSDHDHTIHKSTARATSPTLR